MLASILLASLLLAQPASLDVKPQPDAPAAAPATSTPRDISDLLAPLIAKHAIPGMAAAVVRDGQIIAVGTSGIRELNKSEAVTTGDLWHLGSCTKAMTGTLAAVMIEKKEIAWETTLADVFPDVAMKDAWKAVTLRQLLTNRSGAPTSLDEGGLWAKLWDFKGTPTEARLALLAGVVASEPQAAPGSKFIYSNAGFAIAGAMLEKKSGKSWEDLIQTRLFQPVGITTAGFGAPGDAKTVSQPRGHRNGKACPPGPGADNPPAIAPAGTVHMSIADWARFAALHADAQAAIKNPSDSPALRLLPASAWARLHEPYPAASDKDANRYAAGWGVATRSWAKGTSPADTGLVLTHSGSNTMWHCVTWIAPERRFAIVVACNLGDGQAAKGNDAACGALIQEFLVKPSKKDSSPPR
jgi:CubicO group peptidase (beta-lactamase class C family)